MKEIEDGSVQFRDEDNNITYVYKKPNPEKLREFESWYLSKESVKAFTENENLDKDSESV